jgi:hypothetical protein
MALAGSADNRYTLDLVPAMLASDVPKLLVWGEDDTFQKLGYAERFASEVPGGFSEVPALRGPAGETARGLRLVRLARQDKGVQVQMVTSDGDRLIRVVALLEPGFETRFPQRRA